LLYDLLNGVNIPQTEERTEDVLRDILEQVSRQASIDFRPYKTSTILRRISRRMAVTHNRTMRDYADYLKLNPEEVGNLVKAFLINVTQFFRDADAFAYLRSDILPILIARARQRDHVLRLWAAGCATGEEPYSLAMLLTDQLGAELPEWSVKIFATDLDEAAITFARRGLYSENLLKGVPSEYRERFFERVDHGYRISKTLRQMVIFGQQDLSRSAPFPRIDLVLCRNVLIYFTPELQDYVLNQFAFSLSLSGYLFLGKAETVRPMQSFYELVNKHWKVYRCIGNALPSTRHQSLSELRKPRVERSAMNGPNRSLGKQHAEQEPQPPSLELGQLRRFNELLLRFLPIGVIIIDRMYHILTANGSARRLLGLRDVAVDQDFLHAVRGIPYTETRSGIDTVFRERNVVTLPEVELKVASGGNGRFISLSIALMQLEPSLPDLAAISVTDVTEQVQVRRQLETVQTEQAELMQELGTANKRLSDMNKELMDANEELQVANEELVLTHEELQASIEEFETTNEELQATNEELETNNEELQATNEELETTNEELRARTSELQELTTILENDRVRLSEMVELAPFYILVLRGPVLLVEAYNPRYARLLEGREVQGRPLEEVIDLFWEPRAGPTLTRMAREVYSQETPHTMPRVRTIIPGTQGDNEERREAYFSYTLVPSHDASGRVDGVIIYASDETEQHARELQEEFNQLKTIFDNTRTAALALFYAETQTLIMASPRYLELVTQAHNIPPDNVIGRSWQEITLLSAEDSPLERWKTVVEDRTSFRIPELTLSFASDGSETVWDYDLTPIVDTEEPDTVCYVLVSAVEITDQVHARKDLERLEHLRDDFLSLATHELRTPLTSIQGNTQMLQRTLKRHVASLSQEQAREYHLDQGLTQIDSVLRQLKSMNSLIAEMFDVARLRGEGFELHLQENVDLVALVRSIVEQQGMQSHRISVQSSEETIPVTLDKDRIEQVLNNLLSNAVKYSPSGTSIAVTVEQRQDADEVIVAIRDEGDGIQEEDQAHIFERFYRVRTEENGHVDGLGLGLYIAYGIVKQHDGRMWLESQPGKGSTFFFALPL
ncbi:MAG: PAS domain-containing protein, partial [Ktedonobacteraceae bacterium]|nr:PAS domain-containing protein [Ktedonobacteraceae bacterium]